ncbi:MAG: DinB family protein [Corynebacteriales bacterium]|nr:DinB family protein [Mycobacteriales bacterium]
MSTSRLEIVQWQFELTWALFEFHLERLEPEDLLWIPAEQHWTVRQDATGVWVPDWQDSELDPIPVPTIAWVTWHIGWWWSVALDHVHGKTPRERAEISWPGTVDGTVNWLRELAEQWRTMLSQQGEADLDAIAPFPWGNDPQFTIAHMCGWVNAELMKNVAEVGQLRLLRAASGGK